MNRIKQPTGIDIIALVKPNGERYVYVYNQGDRFTLTLALGRHAANPELSLTWKEAANVILRVRKMDGVRAEP